MIKLEEFKDYKKLLEATITNKAFRSRMMFEGIEDSKFARKILEYISVLNKQINADELNNIFNNIRKDTVSNCWLICCDCSFKREMNSVFSVVEGKKEERGAVGIEERRGNGKMNELARLQTGHVKS